MKTIEHLNAFGRAARRAGATMSSTLATAIISLNQAALQRARERDLTRTIARQVGLTDEQAREVIDAWVEHYRATPLDADEQVIRDACVLRAQGDDWQPDRMPRDWWLR